MESVVTNQTMNYMMTTLAMFVLMGEVLNISGASSELYKAFKLWFGRIKGGMAMATIGASSIFAAASGSSLATVASLGPISSKEMVKSGYSKALAGGAIVSSGTLGILIPPSTFMILYGILAQQHIGKLLMAGLVPGILLALFFILTVVVAVMVKPTIAPKGESYSWKEKLRALPSVIPIMVLFLIVIGGMYAGIYGPTEAAGAGAFFALLITALQRKLNWANFKTIMNGSVRTIGFIFGIMISALVLNNFLVHAKTTGLLSSFITNLQLEPLTVFISVVIIYLILGAFMDAMAAMVITIPIILPVIEMLGFDLIWFGVIMCLLVEVGMISPPVGMNVFVLRGIVPEMGLVEIFKGALLFIIPIFVLIALLYVYPEIALYLPSKL
jgi:tripartite ATP-independent transporter DctM subunit